MFYITKYKFKNAHKLSTVHNADPKSYWKYLYSLNLNSETKTPELYEIYDFFKTSSCVNEYENVKNIASYN